MKHDITEFVSRCLTCQKLKADHHRSQGLLHPLLILELKGESISIDFVCGFPRTPKGKSMIFVIVDRLTKSTHFILMKNTCSKHQVAMAYK